MPQIVTIPGGTATLRSMAELSPRQRRIIRPYAVALASRMQQVVSASTVVGPNGQTVDTQALDGSTLNLTVADADVFCEMQDASAVALLVEWTLPYPLPKSVDDLYDVDDRARADGHDGLYDAIAAVAAKEVAASTTVSGFSVDSVEDPQSPTGASAA